MAMGRWDSGVLLMEGGGQPMGIAHHLRGQTLVRPGVAREGLYWLNGRAHRMVRT